MSHLYAYDVIEVFEKGPYPLESVADREATSGEEVLDGSVQIQLANFAMKTRTHCCIVLLF